MFKDKRIMTNKSAPATPVAQAEPVGNVYEIHTQMPTGVVISHHAVLHDKRPPVKHNDLLYTHPATAVSAAECAPLIEEIEALRQDGSRLTAERDALRETLANLRRKNAALQDAVNYWEGRV
jgi:hypothetical protein